MIVKVAPKRQDNKTSFTDLLDYITEGFDKEVDIREVSFNQLTQYISNTTTFDGMGDMVDKTIAIEIGNLTSLKTASSEMWAVASQNKRCDDPVLHYILSWPEHERPESSLIIEAARYTLNSLGLSDHQYIIAVHANTDNLHAHIEVNLVHPETYKAKHLEWLHKTLHKAARELEIKNNWSHDNGLYVVLEADGKKFIVPNDEYVDPDVGTISTRAKHYEVWSGSESFETWLKTNVAEDVKKVVQGKKLKWDDIHNVLDAYGVELQAAGSGFVVVNKGEQSDQDEPVAIAASKVFRFLKKDDLEKRLGEFSQRQDFVATEDGKAPTAIPIKQTYKRDPLKRLVRKLERREAREALQQRYKEYRADVAGAKDLALRHMGPTIKASQNKRLTTLANKYRLQRLKIGKDDRLTAEQKRQTYVVLKLSYVQARRELVEQFKKERRELNQITPQVKTWRSWVEEQAALGDEAAVSALRGMVYQEGRDAKKGRGVSEVEPGNDTEVMSIRPTVRPDNTDPTVKAIENLTWRVSTNGRVIYSLKGRAEHAFIDDGMKVSYGKKLVRDDDLAASLAYAKLKWNTGITIRGGDIVFRERVLRAAVAQGIKVNNPELQSLQKQIAESQKRKTKTKER